MNVLLEYLIVFVALWVCFYFIIIVPKLKKKKEKKPTELYYLKKIYKINIKDINYKQFVYIYNTINTFIITTIYIIVVYLIDNFILKIIVGCVLLILLFVICYGLLARYYIWKEGRK